MLARQIVGTVRLVLTDLSGTLVFAALLALGVDVLAATVAGIVAALTTVAITMLRRKPVGPLQWLSLALVIVSGAATLLTSDPRFVMAKPSVIATIVGLFMLKRGWLERYLPPAIAPLIPDVTVVFGYIWAGLMFVTAILNLIVVLRFPEAWVVFIAVFPAVSKLLLLALHLGVAVVVAKWRHSDPALTSHVSPHPM